MAQRSVPSIDREEDVPDSPDTSSNTAEETSLSDREVRKLEIEASTWNAFKFWGYKTEQLKLEKELKNKGYRLMVGCLVALFVMFILETVLLNYNQEIGDSFSALFELLKFLISSLSGYLFSLTIHAKEE